MAVSSPLENLLIGRTLVGRYEVERPIGRGGMSVVYRAIDRRLDRPVALKVVSFPAELGEGERKMLRERLRREAAAAAKLSPHPNVVQVYDYGTDGELDLDFIVMELLPGIDLKHAMRERRLTVDEGLRILTAAARGVAAGHRAGLVHRDVKPANIYLVEAADGDIAVVKMLDFGIAKALDPGVEEELTRFDTIPHSPAYTSPEQLDPARRLTPASDVYQLGLVAYELLAGERPYTEAERERLRAGRAVALAKRGRWRDLPAHLRVAIERALALDPAARFPDAHAFAEALYSDPDSETVALEAPLPATRTIGPDLPAAVSSRTGKPRVGNGRRFPLRAARLAAGLAGLGLIGWLVVAELDSPIEITPIEIEIPDLDELHEEFRPLLLDAFEALREMRE